MRRRPIILVGKAYWNGFMNLLFLADEGASLQEDVDLITIVDTAQEAWANSWQWPKRTVIASTDPAFTAW
jgi:predicted Rossmann-fold nucleotide-binding protein